MEYRLKGHILLLNICALEAILSYASSTLDVMKEQNGCVSSENEHNLPKSYLYGVILHMLEQLDQKESESH